MRRGCFAPVFGTLAVVSILYGACLALVQTDIKKIIAYSSISHLGYVMLGLVSLDLIGIQGAVDADGEPRARRRRALPDGRDDLRALPHPRSRGLRRASRSCLPVYSVFLAVLTLAAIGLPTTSGFTGEFLVLLGAFRAAWPQYARRFAYPLVLSASAVAGVVLGALYMLCFAQRFLFGVAKAPHQPFSDLNFREKADSRPRSSSRCSRSACFPDEPMRKTELAARQYQQLVEQRADRRWRRRIAMRHCRVATPAARSPPPITATVASRARDELDQTIVIAMLPEHLLLARDRGAARLEIAPGSRRAAHFACRCSP